MTRRLPEPLATAAAAVLAKKAEDVLVLDLRKVVSFTDFFLLATGTNQRQLIAMADAVEETLRKGAERRPRHTEGYPRQEWILMDYGDFLVHLFTPATRTFYDLERLWGGAERIEVEG